MKILIVDDSGTMRSIEKKILMSLGQMDISEASDGQEAVMAVTSKKFDLVLMDWNMPRLSGIEALKQIKANPATRDTPVIMVTSESEKSNIIEAIKSGAANYIVKPFTAEILQTKLAAYLKKD